MTQQQQNQWTECKVLCEASNVSPHGFGPAYMVLPKFSGSNYYSKFAEKMTFDSLVEVRVLNLELSKLNQTEESVRSSQDQGSLPAVHVKLDLVRGNMKRGAQQKSASGNYQPKSYDYYYSVRDIEWPTIMSTPVSSNGANTAPTMPATDRKLIITDLTSDKMDIMKAVAVKGGIELFREDKTKTWKQHGAEIFEVLLNGFEPDDSAGKPAFKSLEDVRKYLIQNHNFTPELIRTTLQEGMGFDKANDYINDTVERGTSYEKALLELAENLVANKVFVQRKAELVMDEENYQQSQEAF